MNAIKRLFFNQKPEKFWTGNQIQSVFKAHIEAIEEKISSDGLSLVLIFAGNEKTKYNQFVGDCVISLNINENTKILMKYNKCRREYCVYIELKDKPGLIYEPIINEFIDPTN